MKNLHKVVLALVLALCACVVYTSCVSPEDTQRGAEIHKRADDRIAAAESKLASGEMTQEQFLAEVSAAMKQAKDELKKLGDDISDRTKSFWQNGENILGLGAAQLLQFLLTNAYRNRTRRTDPNVTNDERIPNPFPSVNKVG